MSAISELFDLYEFPGYIAKTDAHQAVRLVFVPMMPSRIERIDKAKQRMYAPCWREKMISAISTQILEWDLPDPDGHAWFPGAYGLGHVHEPLREKIISLVRGSLPNDPDPEGDAPLMTSASWLAAMRRNLIDGLRQQLGLPDELADRGQMMLGFDERVYARRDHNTAGEAELEKPNAELVACYHRYKTCGWDWMPESWRRDALLTDSFAVIDRIYKEHERHELAWEMSQAAATTASRREFQQSFL